jgi:hypothetical protein
MKAAEIHNELVLCFGNDAYTLPSVHDWVNSAHGILIKRQHINERMQSGSAERRNCFRKSVWRALNDKFHTLDDRPLKDISSMHHFWLHNSRWSDLWQPLITRGSKENCECSSKITCKAVVKSARSWLSRYRKVISLSSIWSKTVQSRCVLFGCSLWNIVCMNIDNWSLVCSD